jgi:hypothetical protein
MEATTQLKSDSFANSSENIIVQKQLTSYDKFIEKLHFSYFGLISMTILVGSIVGGITASVVLNNDAPIWELCLVAAVSMASNTAGIGQAPVKWVFNLFIISIIINMLLIVINI